MPRDFTLSCRRLLALKQSELELAAKRLTEYIGYTSPGLEGDGPREKSGTLHASRDGQFTTDELHSQPYELHSSPPQTEGTALLTFVTACMGRLSFLQQTLESLKQFSECSCIVVDYSCPDHCGEWVSKFHPDVEVVRIKGETVYNRCRAKNAGAAAAVTEWICFVDCDVVVQPDFMRAVEPQLRVGSYCRAHPLIDPGLWGTFVVRREDFERIGGFDEAFEGWGEEDCDMYSTLDTIGLVPRRFPSSVLQHIPHGHELRTRHQDDLDRVKGWSINQFYSLVKQDMIRQTGKLVPLSNRIALYREIRESARSAMESGRDLEFVVSISPTRDLANGYQVRRQIAYRLNAPDKSS